MIGILEHKKKMDEAEAEFAVYLNKLSKGELLEYKWFIDRLREYDSISIWFSACHKFHIFQLYPKEFIEELAKSIKDFHPTRIIEVGAGNGYLSKALQKQGIDIIPTDNKSWAHLTYPSEVEKLDFKEALAKYNPDMVVICWEAYGADYTREILKHPSVKWVIWIGENFGGCCGIEDLDELPHRILENPSKYAVCRTDMVFERDNKLQFIPYSKVYIFDKQ